MTHSLNTERQRIIEAFIRVTKHLDRIKDAYLKTIVLARTEYERQVSTQI